MKPRSDCALFSLSVEDQEKLNNWLLDNHSYAEVQRFLAAEAPEGMGLKVHQTSISRYYDRVMPDYIAGRRKSATATSRHLKTAIEAEPNEFDLTTLDALKQRVFELTLSPKSNPDTIYKFYRLILRAKNQELARQKFEFDAAHIIMENFDAIAKIMRQRDQSDDRETIDRIRLSIFGVLPERDEPLTGDDYNSPREEPIHPPTPPRPSVPSVPSVPSPPPPSEITHSLPTNDPKVPDPVIIPPKLAPGCSNPPAKRERPLPPKAFEHDPNRPAEIRWNVDEYGSYCLIEYLDGENSQRNRKYILNNATGGLEPRKEQ